MTLDLPGWGLPRIVMTIDHTQVGETLTNYPVPLIISDSSGSTGKDCRRMFLELWGHYLKIHVSLADGTPCYVEVAEWDPIARFALLYVRVPSVSAVADTELCVFWNPHHADNTDYVGATGEVAAQQVWGTSSKGVWHMKPITAMKKTLYAGERSGSAADGGVAQASIAFSPVNCAGLTKQNGWLKIDLKCSAPENLTTNSCVEITSSGTCDSQKWGLLNVHGQYGVTTDWKTYYLPLSKFATSGGELNPANVNYIRWFNFIAAGAPSTTIYWKNAEILSSADLPDGTGVDVVLDSTSNRNLGLVYGAMETTGPLGKCLLFDGIDDWIDLGNDPSLQNFSAKTLTIWLRGMAGYMGSYRKVYDGSYWSSPYGDQVYLHTSRDTYNIGLRNTSSTIVAAGGSFEPGGDLILGYSWDGATRFVFANGACGTPAEFTGTLACSSRNVTIGRALDGYTYCDGLFPYIEISSVARSPAWIAATNAALTDDLITFRTTPGGDSGSHWWAVHGALGFLPDITKLRVQDAYLRFARKATAEIYDPDGAIAEVTPRDTSIRLYAATSPRSTPHLRFGGFVIDVRTGQDLTTLDLLSFDFWLKRRVVYKTYTNTGLHDIVQDLITTLTPLVWDPALVDLTNDIVISQVWKGEALDSVLSQVAAMSQLEEWGADDDGKFFCRERDVRTSPRHFTEGQYIDARFEEDGRMEINRVVIYYGQPPNTGAVAVQDRAAQLALQLRYGAPRPVVIEVTRTYPEITTEEDARTRATSILANRTVIRTGEIETWGAVAVRPGDVCAVVVPDQQIDGSYRVAQIEYSYPEDQTTVRLAENNEGVVDVLVELSDEVSRIDARDADPDATLVEVINLLEEVEIETELAVYVIHVAAGVFLFGDPGGNLGDPRVGGGVLGDPGGRTRVI